MMLPVILRGSLVMENCDDSTVLAQEMNMTHTKFFLSKFLRTSFVQVSPMFYPNIFQGIYLEQIVTIRRFEMSALRDVEDYFRFYEKLINVHLTTEIIKCFYDKQKIIVIYSGQYKGLFQYARKFIERKNAQQRANMYLSFLNKISELNKQGVFIYNFTPMNIVLSQDENRLLFGFVDKLFVSQESECKKIMKFDVGPCTLETQMSEIANFLMSTEMEVFGRENFLNVMLEKPPKGFCDDEYLKRINLFLDLDFLPPLKLNFFQRAVKFVRGFWVEKKESKYASVRQLTTQALLGKPSPISLEEFIKELGLFEFDQSNMGQYKKGAVDNQFFQFNFKTMLLLQKARSNSNIDSCSGYLPFDIVDIHQMRTNSQSNEQSSKQLNHWIKSFQLGALKNHFLENRYSWTYTQREYVEYLANNFPIDSKGQVIEKLILQMEMKQEKDFDELRLKQDVHKGPMRFSIRKQKPD